MKRLTALILAAAILAAFCVPAAAVENPAFSVNIVGTADSAKPFSGKDTLVLDWQIKAEKDSLTLQNTQGLRLAYDNTVLQLVRWDAASAIDDSTIQENSFATVSGAYGMGVYQYNMRVYAAKSSDSSIGFLSLALGDGDETYVCAQGDNISLLKVRFAFREGKALSNLTPSSIRIMTPQELKTLNQATGVLLNTTESGGTSYEYAKHNEGTPTDNDTLNAPKITYPGSIGVISSATITGFVAPIMGATPIEFGVLGTADEHYTITSLVWEPIHSTFAPNTDYTATVVLTADSSYKFAALTPDVNTGTPSAGIISPDEEGNTLTFTVTFPQTSNKNDVSGTITFADASPTYNRNPHSLAATSTNETGGSFTYSYSGTTYPTSATPPTNAGTYSVTATYESETANGTKTATLTINKAPLTIDVTATNREYNGTTTVELTGGSLVGVIEGDTSTDIDFDLSEANIETADFGTEKPVTTRITLKGSKADNYELTQPDVTVNITQANISGAKVAISGNYTYTGSAITPQTTDVTVTLGDRTLTPQTDYTFAASDNTDAGTAKLTVTGQGNYTGSKDQGFIIAQKGVIASDLSKDIPENNTYTGQPQGIGEVTGSSGIGTITVYYTGKSGTTYEISTAAPMNAGTYAVTADIAASTNYATASSLALGDYTIAKASLTITGANIAEKTYDKTTTATVTGVTFSGEQNSEELAFDTDYTVSSAAFSAVGAGAGTVTGTVALTNSDKAKNYSLTNSALSQSATISPAEYTYEVDSTQQIKVGSGLSAITVAPANGAGVGGETVAGTLTWHKDSPTGTAAQDSDISGLVVQNKITLHWSFAASDPNYISTPKTGTTEFEIVEGDPQEVAFTTTEAIIKIYGDAEFTNAAVNSSTSGGAVSYESSNSSIATVDAAGKVTILSAGTITITAKAAAVPGTWRETAVYYTLTVNPKTLTDDMLSISGTYTYNGSAQSPSYTVKDGETILAIDTDYTADVLSVTNANKYTLTVTGTGNYSDSVSKDFIIAPKTLDNSMLSIDGTYTYDGTAQSPAYTVTDGAALTKGTDYTETALPSATDAGSYTLTVTGKGNYTGTASRTFTIAKADLTSGDISASLTHVIYDGTAKPVAVSIPAKTGYGTLTVKYDDSESAPINAGNYAVIVGISGGANFNAATGISLGTYTINQASVAGVAQSVNAKAGVEKTYAVALETLLPSNVNASQVSAYTLGTITDTHGMIDNAAISGSVLSIPVKDSAEATQTATLEITFTSANYAIASAVVTVNVTAKNPVNISGVTVASRAYNGGAIAYGGTPVFTDVIENAPVGLTPVFTWQGGGAAPTDAGGYTLTVSADGGDDYEVAPLVISFEIAKANQTVSFEAPSVNRVGRAAVLTASATSGLPVAFTTSDASIAAITNGTLELAGEGTVTITASQAGDGNHNAAPDVSHTIVILPAASDDTSLAALSISDGIAIVPAFDPTVASYTASVGSGVGSVTVTATPNHAGASVSGDGVKQLSTGENIIEIIVTAEDGTTVKTHTITVTRAAPSPSFDIPGTSGSTDTSKTTSSTDGAVSVSYTQSGGVVTVSLPDGKVNEIISKSNDVAVIDLSKASGATSASLPVSALTKLAESGLAVELRLPQGEITLEADAAASIAEQAGGAGVSVGLKSVSASALNARQQEAIGDAPVYDISVSSGSKQITSFGGASAAIVLPYTLKADQKPAGVVALYVDGDGNTEKLPTSYDTNSKKITFTTTHLSLYAIAYDEALATPWINPFLDIKASDWFYGDVEYAYTKGLMTGTTSNTFSPANQMTRAMLVTVLYRAAPYGTDVSLNVPAGTGNAPSGATSLPSSEAPFADVPLGEWYSDAIAWAAQAGIVNGIGGGKFAPGAEITRQDLAVLLYRYAQTQLTADRGVLSGFADAEAVSEYARDALAWAISAGIVRGDDNDRINPKGLATRADAATMLHRFLSE